jgi:predicted transcriptional regulator
MADTVTINLSPEAAAALQRLATEHGQTPEQFASRLVEDATSEFSAELSNAQIAELQRRLAKPTPIASAERTAEVLRKFGIQR